MGPGPGRAAPSGLTAAVRLDRPDQAWQAGASVQEGRICGVTDTTCDFLARDKSRSAVVARTRRGGSPTSGPLAVLLSSSRILDVRLRPWLLIMTSLGLRPGKFARRICAPGGRRRQAFCAPAVLSGRQGSAMGRGAGPGSFPVTVTPWFRVLGAGGLEVWRSLGGDGAGRGRRVAGATPRQGLRASLSG